MLTCMRYLGAPPEETLGFKGEQWPRWRLGPIRGVALEQRVHRLGRVGWIEDPHRAERLRPGQLGPVVVVMVDGERRPRARAQPTDTGKALPLNQLWLLINHRHQLLTGQGIGNWEHSGPPLVVDQPEPRHAGAFHQLAGPPRQLG